MGAVKQVLADRHLNDREGHNSRLFVDLCENIHIHFREYRLIFSLNEYFEFVDVLTRSTQDVRNYLANNPEYQEEAYPTTIMVACGWPRQYRFLEHSPAPHKSAYHDNFFAIELQEEHVTDEIHVHWRDLRIVLNRENFKQVATAFGEALRELTAFESTHAYQRAEHPDRKFTKANQEQELPKGRLQGVTPLAVEQCMSYWFRLHEANWFEVFQRDWQRNDEYIAELERRYQHDEPITPIVVSQPNEEGVHYIVNGHHRYLAARKVGRPTIDALVLPMSFEETAELRQAEQLLKKFDLRTGYEHGTTSFFNDFVANKLNKFYRNDFQRRLREQLEKAAAAPVAVATVEPSSTVSFFSRAVGKVTAAFRKAA